MAQFVNPRSFLQIAFLQIKPSPDASSRPAARKWKPDAIKERPMATADELFEPKARSNSDTRYVRHGRRRTPHLLGISWDSGSLEPREGKSQRLPRRGDSRESEVRYKSAAAGRRCV